MGKRGRYWRTSASETSQALKANTHGLACGIREADLGGEKSMGERYRRGIPELNTHLRLSSSHEARARRGKRISFRDLR